MKDGVVCVATCSVKDCPYKYRGESPSEARKVDLKYTTFCKEEA